jgi:NADH dehydrogenase
MAVTKEKQAAQPNAPEAPEPVPGRVVIGPRAAHAPLNGRTPPPRVVIIGAGFGGLNAARALGGQDVRVLLVDRNNYHGFWPLLYQVATAGLEPESIAYPVRAILRKYRNVRFLMLNVTRVDLEQRQVIPERGRPIPYDYLILSAGSTNNYFGNNDLAAHTFGLKDLDEAERLRNRVLSAFERAVRERDPARRKELLTFVIVGGGPTGVELAGAFAELIRHVMRKDYPTLKRGEAQVILVEATDKILTAFPENLQQSALRQLDRMGVDVRLNSPVEAVNGRAVTFKGGESLATDTVIWTAGIRGASVADTLGVELGRGARVPVGPTLHLADHPEVFVIGDMALLETYKDGKPYPQVAQVAIQQGHLAARNILAALKGEPLRPFHYVDKGNMATIGRRSAILDAYGIQLSGPIAWLGWLVVHIFYLIGFRNRLLVLANWAYNYFTYDRAVRVITGLR